MAINKVGSKGIEDGSVATADFAPGTVTNAKLENTSFTLEGTSIALGDSDNITISADWQSVITADGSTGTTAVAGNGYFIDTTSAAHTLTLPTSATIGDFVAIKDYAGTFNTNNLTIARNGHNIQGVANDSLITTNRASLVLVYVDSTKGWLYWEEHNVADLSIKFIEATGGTVSTSGDYKIHTFTGDGCFVVSQIGNTAVPTTYRDKVEYLVVAGGGGGGGFYGGAGAGGFRESDGKSGGCYSVSPLANACGALTVTATTYPVTVGAGGAEGNTANPGTNNGSSGSNSIFSTITSTGGGFGSGVPNGPAAGNGGSGGGEGYANAAGAGSGNTPPTSPSQGNPGGTGTPGEGGGGGGGGATAAGGNAAAPFGSYGPGGAGATTSISGSSTSYAGGGGGGTANAPSAILNNGGLGGGGSAYGSNAITGEDGTANTGGGGAARGGTGGKGIVIIRYKFQ